jgi:hypothetical protein
MLMGIYIFILTKKNRLHLYKMSIVLNSIERNNRKREEARRKQLKAGIKFQERFPYMPSLMGLQTIQRGSDMLMGSQKLPIVERLGLPRNIATSIYNKLREELNGDEMAWLEKNDEQYTIEAIGREIARVSIRDYDDIVGEVVEFVKDKREKQREEMEENQREQMKRFMNRRRLEDNEVGNSEEYQQHYEAHMADHAEGDRAERKYPSPTDFPLPMTSPRNGEVNMRRPVLTPRAYERHDKIQRRKIFDENVTIRDSPASLPRINTPIQRQVSRSATIPQNRTPPTMDELRNMDGRGMLCASSMRKQQKLAGNDNKRYR